MPYIDKERREKLDFNLKGLDAELEKLGDNPGDFNYVISCLLWRMFARTRRYVTINTIMGVLSSASHEFYIRFARGYEDEALAKNGDVDEYWWNAKKVNTPKGMIPCSIEEPCDGCVEEGLVDDKYGWPSVGEVGESVGMQWLKRGDPEDPGGQGC